MLVKNVERLHFSFLDKSTSHISSSKKMEPKIESHLLHPIHPARGAALALILVTFCNGSSPPSEGFDNFRDDVEEVDLKHD
ncbi:hypothetical protein PoB_001727500 [Plakobranchus ocellatus]|uniref:Uncharacterized protein n=1 Tax=Plakobranchus ocellatus TaxID=259542 RepID=A0AAV3Z5N5_9GAST|nr:hypothetical protein PoB_001727500 [Plakobranchus ocellatus]